MKTKLLSIGVALLILSGCSNDYEETKRSLEITKQENLELRKEVEKLSGQWLASETKLKELEQTLTEKLLDVSTENENFKKEVVTLEEALAETRSWSRLPQEANVGHELSEHNTIRFINALINENITPIHAVIICDTYISKIESIDDRNFMIFKLYESLDIWEAKYNKSISEIINKSVEGDYKERLYAEWTAKGMIEKEISEIESLENEELKNILIDAKHAGFIASSSEEVVVLEHDPSFLIEKYREYISDELLVYIELEVLMNRYGTWHSEEASKMQLELIKTIKSDYIESQYRLLSPQELDAYEEELKYQLENIMHWDTYGFIQTIGLNHFAI